jgi:hypothetical protein
LGPLLCRLAPALDALTSAEHEPNGDVDGFDGVTRRGSYERLLSSEWALQKYAPLEFLRRAVSGEQTFFAVARREPVSRQSTLALFDAGPDQLGDCRLAQLALLVLLEQRAQSSGQELLWQHVHRFGEGLERGLTEASVRSFLQGRTAARSSVAAWNTWREQAKTRRVWLVGPSRTTTTAPEAFARVTLRQRVAAEALVDVTLESGGRRRNVALEVPGPADAARLLRDPFDTARARQVATPPVSSGLYLTLRGTRIFYRTRDSDLASVAVPNSPRAPVGSPRVHRAAPGEILFAIGASGRKHYRLSRREQTLRVTSQEDAKATFGHLPPPDPDTLTPCAWYPSEKTVLFQCAERGLWRADFRTQRCVQVAKGVRDWLKLGGAYFVAVDRWFGGAEQSSCVLSLAPFTERVVFAQPEGWEDARFAVAHETKNQLTLGRLSDGAWTLSDFTPFAGVPWVPENHRTLRVPRDALLLGVDSRTRLDSGLWLLEGDRRRISLVSRSYSRVVLTSPSPIDRACVASGAPVVALTNAERQLLVATATGEVRYRGSYT